MPQTVKVAVVGSGLAGLTAASLLCTGRHEGNVTFECHLFEQSDDVGMDSSSISVHYPNLSGASQSEWRIDVPMRSFQGGYYKELIKLYETLNIPYHVRDFSYAFSEISKSKEIITSMIFNGNSGRAGVGIPSKLDATAGGREGINVQRVLNRTWTLLCFVLSTILLLYHYLRLVILSSPFIRPTGNVKFNEWCLKTTPRNFLARAMRSDKAWQNFIEDVLIPLFSAVCTAPREDILDHPVEELLEYVWLTFGTHHYVVTNGVRDVVQRLVAPIHHVHVASPITALKPDPNCDSAVVVICSTAGGVVEYPGFRHVILATGATVAAKIVRNYAQTLDQPSQHKATISELSDCLEKFTSRTTIVVNHTDDSLLPIDSRDWRDLNLVYANDGFSKTTEDPQQLQLPPSYTMATHMLPEPSGYNLRRRILQTTNPIITPRKGSVLSVARLQRAVVTTRSKIALESLSKSPAQWWDITGRRSSSLGRLQGSSHAGPQIWVCGSYAWRGIPLLEGCVRSAQDVIEQGIWKTEGVLPIR